MPKRKKDRRKVKLAALINRKTESFVTRKEAQQHDNKRSGRLVELLYINGMLR